MTIAIRKSSSWMLTAGAAFLAVGVCAPSAFAADHRDSFAVDTEIEGDYTDAFGWPDPDRPGNIILAGMVNPFATPGLTTSYRFSETFLYQIHIDNNQANGAAPDLVMQVQFGGTNSRAGNQPYRVFLGPATGSNITTRLVPGGPGVVELCQPVNTGSTTLMGGTGFFAGAPTTFAASATGTGAVQDNYIHQGLGGQTNCYAGVADDSFITDATQAILRVGLNSNARSRTVPSLRTGQALTNYVTGADNQPNHTQDLFRFATGDLIGGLRGRPLQLNVRSGVDTFGGFNGSLFAVSVPGNLLRGAGIPDQSRGGAINPSLIGTYGTVSRPAVRTFDGLSMNEQGPFHQFERMGQQITATVFVFQQPMLDPTAAPGGAYRHLVTADFAGTGVTIPASFSSTTPLPTALLKDLHNATGPEHDVRLWDRMYPDSLTTTPAGQNNTGGGLLGGLISGLSNLLIGGGNTVQGRQAIVTVLGFNSFGINGVPLYSGQFASFSNNQNRRLQAQLGLPDYLRINLDTTFDSAPGNSRPGAAAANNNSPTLALNQWGLQNGRRPADDVTDIVLRITRETADVKFPDTLVLPGIANVLPGSGPRLSSNGFARRAVNCEELNVVGGILNGGLIGNLLNGGVLGLLRPGESDGLLGRLSLNVLTPCEDARVFLVLSGTDFIEPAADVANVANQNSEQQHLRTTFPYIGFNPLTGEAGTTGFSPTNP